MTTSERQAVADAILTELVRQQTTSLPQWWQELRVGDDLSDVVVETMSMNLLAVADAVLAVTR